ncbi:MAG: hypothetical protein QG597_4644, partial [Actinomycetota bacterium]|nr:hypothetical protein [Actinomycetota bacterium]
LTARQVANVAVAGGMVWLAWRLHGPVLPPAVIGISALPVLGVAVVVAVGRRDGISLDAWLLAALRAVRAPRRLVAAPEGIPPAPAWAPDPHPPRSRRRNRRQRRRRCRRTVPGTGLTPLRLPVERISESGAIDTGDGWVAVTAVGTVSFGLRTSGEQYALIEAWGRWLNSLTAPVQVVVSTRAVDLYARADHITDGIDALPHPALADAAADYCDFLLQLADDRDPLDRRVLIVHRVPRDGGPRAARRLAEHTARALAGLGSPTRVLHGGLVTDALASACSPWHPTPAGLATPDTLITTDPTATPGWTVVPFPPGEDTGPTAPGQGPATDARDARRRTRRQGNDPADGHRPVEDAAFGVSAVVGPGSIDVTARSLHLGDGSCATYAVIGYPATVTAPWLEPILSWPGRLDVAIHIDPVSPDAAARQLRRARARLESSRRLDADAGRLGDPATDAAAADAADLADQVARGAARLFRAGVYVTVHAPTEQTLIEACAQVHAAAASVLLRLEPVTHRHLQGWTSTLPLTTDTIRIRRTLDTGALAAAFPLACPDLPAPLPGDPPATTGVLYGVNLASAGVIVWDRWTQDNHNSDILARSGAGKSYLIKLDVLRNLYDGVHVAVVDPEDEYVRLAHAVGGTVVQLGAPGVRLNPLDLPATDRRPGALTRRALFLHTVVAVLASPQDTTSATVTHGGLTPAETAALDGAILDTYHAAGITADPATWATPAPLLADLADTLRAADDDAAHTLAAKLAPWVTGSFSGLFDGPTTTRPEGHLVVWSLRHLPDEVTTIGTLLALDSIWRSIDRPTSRQRPPGGHRRRLVVIDEAWTMLRQPSAASWLFKMAKAARKRNAGVSVVTQDVADLLGSDLGQAVVANATTQILMRQAPQAIDAVADAFGLTDTERGLLLAARRGEALLVAGSARLHFEVVSSADEDVLAGQTDTTSPPQHPSAPSDDVSGADWTEEEDLF